MDLIIPTARFPYIGETVLGGDLRMVAGGKGANQACAAARLGARTSMIAQVGNDAFGKQAIDSLRLAGVDTSLIEMTDRSTGTAMINVRGDGQNTIVLSPGANATLDPETALSRLPRLTRGDMVLLQLEIPIETVEAVAERANGCGATVILDPAPFQPMSASLLHCVDYLTPNQIESAVLRGVSAEIEVSFEGLSSAGRELRSRGPVSVILKLGADGSFLNTPTMELLVKPFVVEAVDTTAAGDVFNAAFAVALSESASIADAARFGNAASALSVTRMGAQSSIPSRADVDAFLDARLNISA